MKTCRLDGCDRRHDSRGYCGMHAMRIRRHGDPHVAKIVNGPGTPTERFWRHVDQTDGCWLWTGGLSRGYGVFWYDGRLGYAHRWSYEHHVGPIPAGLDIDHLCRTPACVRPNHLEPVTRAENIRRGARWGDPVVSA